MLIKYADIVRYEKERRMRWNGNVVRMDKGRRVKRITGWRPIGVRWIGRQRLRWEGDIREDMGKRKILNWRKMAMDREAWKRNVEQAKTDKGL